MENLQNIGQSYLFYSFLKRFKTSIIDVQAYYPEIIALPSDILISTISEKISLLEELQKEPEKIELNSISQIYFSFDKYLTESQYIKRLSSCFLDFDHSKNHPMNQLDFLQISQELKNQIKDILIKINKSDNNEKEFFFMYNSKDNIYHKKSQKINFVDEIIKIFSSNNILEIPVNFKFSLLQLQKMIENKTIVQKILQMKPFFSRKNINLSDTMNTQNECSDSEFDSEYSRSGSGSESDFKQDINDKNNENISENENHLNSSENENSSGTQNEQVLKLKIELNTAMNNLKSAVSENTFLKSKIEKLMIEKVELNEKLQDVDELRKEQIKAVEENAILKKENEKLKNGNDDNSSSMISLVIASSTNLNAIFDQSSKDIITINDSNSNESKNANDSKNQPNFVNLKNSNESKDIQDTKNSKDLKDPKDTNDAIEPIVSKDTKEIKETQDTKNIQDTKDIKDTTNTIIGTKDSVDIQDTKNQKETNDLKESKVTIDINTKKDLKDVKASKDKNEMKDQKDSKDSKDNNQNANSDDDENNKINDKSSKSLKEQKTEKKPKGKFGQHFFESLKKLHF